MKKFIIIAAVILSSAITAFAFSKKADNKAVNTLKIEKSDFAIKNMNAPKSDLATAD